MLKELLDNWLKTLNEDEAVIRVLDFENLDICHGAIRCFELLPRLQALSPDGYAQSEELEHERSAHVYN